MCATLPSNPDPGFTCFPHSGLSHWHSQNKLGCTANVSKGIGFPSILVTCPGMGNSKLEGQLSFSKRLACQLGSEPLPSSVRLECSGFHCSNLPIGDLRLPGTLHWLRVPVLTTEGWVPGVQIKAVRITLNPRLWWRRNLNTHHVRPGLWIPGSSHPSEVTFGDTEWVACARGGLCLEEGACLVRALPSPPPWGSFILRKDCEDRRETWRPGEPVWGRSCGVKWLLRKPRLFSSWLIQKEFMKEEY